MNQNATPQPASSRQEDSAVNPGGRFSLSALTGGGTWLVVLVMFVIFDIQFHYYWSGVTDAVLHRDEANDTLFATQSWSVLLEHFATDWVPYTYLLALRFWVGLFGDSEQAVRSLSLFSTMLATLLTYFGVKNWTGQKGPALAAALLLGCSPVVLRYPFIAFARPYALALMTVSLSFERWVALYRHPSKMNTLWFLVASVLMCNAQPVNLGIGMALAVVWFIAKGFESEKDWKTRMRRALSVPLLLLVSALPTIIQAFRFMGGQGDDKVQAGASALSTIVKYPLEAMTYVFPFSYEILHYALDDYVSVGIRNLVTQAPVELRLVMALAVVLVLVVVVKKCFYEKDKSLFYSILLFLIPVLFLGVAGFFNARMVVPWKAYSGLALGSVLLLVTCLRSSNLLIVLIMVLTMTRTIAGYPSFAESHSGKRSDGKSAAEHIMANEQPEDFILLSNLVMSPTFSYYYHGQSLQTHHPYKGQLFYWHATRLWKHLGESSRVEQTVERLLEAHTEGRRVWFLYGGTPIENLPPERWHHWYSPDAYLACLEVLEEKFEQIGHESFTTTLEPFYVSLYGPVHPPATEAEQR